MRYLTIIHDVCGAPREWGSAPTRQASREEAERQWAARVAKRAAEGTTDISEERGETTTETVTESERAR